jgi:alpha-aminoadipate carrier protein LysW
MLSEVVTRGVRPRCRFAHDIDIIQTLSRSRLPAGFWHVIDPIAKPFGERVTRHPGRAPGFIEDSMATCPECDADVEVDEFDVDKGDQLSCPECGSNLEVTGLSPLELDLVLDDDEEDDDVEDEEGLGDDEDDDEDEDEDKDPDE